jgi:membrane protein YqaA with SNARE-associated domain
MDASSVESLSLAGLFASSFLSATLLPGNSEIVLVAVLHGAPALKWPALVVATIGNTFGGMTSYAIGRFFPRPREGRAVAWLKHYGPAALLLSWAPIVGDALCVASGWLRQNALAAAAFIAIGKFVRYWVLAEGLVLLLTR